MHCCTTTRPSSARSSTGSPRQPRWSRRGRRVWRCVFLYDSSEDKPFAAGRSAIAHAKIEAAGGRNVMADLDTSRAHAAWETLVARNPQFLTLLDHQNVSWSPE